MTDTSQSERREMKCPECSAVIGEHKLFCPECGTNLNNVTAEDVAPPTATDIVVTYILPVVARGIGAVIGLTIAMVMLSIIIYPYGVLYGCASPQSGVGLIHSILLFAQRIAQWLPFPSPC